MSTFFKSLKLTLVFCIFFGVCYIFVLWIFARVAGPNGGKPEVVMLDGKVVGAANVGQSFTEEIYFWGRPSNAGEGYDAGSSAGSNKGALEPEYLKEVNERVDTFLVKHPYLKRDQVPAEMVTASASGLDPHISRAGADVQIKRVADARGMSEEQVKGIVDQVEQGAVLGWFGPSSVINVLKLNVALDEAQGQLKK